MIHHVALETRFEDAQACVAFYALLGFARVEPPETLRDRAVWLALGAQQLHLLLTDEPDVPPQGHVAVVLGDYEAAIARARERGCRRVELDTNETNTPALALYHRFGFSERAKGEDRSLFLQLPLT